MSSGSLLPLIPWRVAGCWLAIDVRELVEILGPTPSVPIENSTTFVSGSVMHRGRPLLLVDIASYFSDFDPTSQPRSRDSA